MNNYGFIRVAAAVPTVKVADTRFNTEEICKLASEAFERKVSLVVFPELSVTGATCGDIFRQSLLLKEAEKGVSAIKELSRGKSTALVVGAPIGLAGQVIACSIVIRNGEIKGIVPTKHHAIITLDYAGQKCLFGSDLTFAIDQATFSLSAESGAHIVVCPSAENELIMTDRRRRLMLESGSLSNVSAYIHAGAGFGESTTDFVHAGSASIWETGECLAENERFQLASSMIVADVDIEKIENLRRSSAASFGMPAGYQKVDVGPKNDTDFSAGLVRHVEPHPFAPAGEIDSRCREILDIQVEGLVRRIERIGSKAVIGISGGLDSTLALLVTVLAFDRLRKFDAKWDRSNIIAVTMPGFGTTSRTKGNAWELMNALGVTCREISIVPACEQHFKDIGHDMSVHDATYENSQARERTQILMDIANQTGGIVVGTGDLSELALGWATYNGDHMSMYGVNAGIPKTLVRSLVIWAAHNRFTQVKDILLDIADTPISPELLPADENGNIKQVTEDLVGPYELHDFFIYNFMRYGYSPEKIRFLAKMAFQNPEKDSSVGTYSDETISKWLKTFIRRFFSQQFKRSCMPDGTKVLPVSLSPRGGWNMASDAWSEDFIADL
jgi:NAD+ synthase (glutamine-hydrolysing)